MDEHAERDTGAPPALPDAGVRARTGEVVTTAQEQASRVTGEAVTQGRRVADEAARQLREQARAQTGRAAGALERFGEQAGALADGRPEDAGEVDDLVRQASEWLSRTAGRVEEIGFDGVVDEVSRFARRRPGGFLAGAAAAGFVAGRLLRNSSGTGPPETP